MKTLQDKLTAKATVIVNSEYRQFINFIRNSRIGGELRIKIKDEFIKLAGSHPDSCLLFNPDSTNTLKHTNLKEIINKLIEEETEKVTNEFMKKVEEVNDYFIE